MQLVLVVDDDPIVLAAVCRVLRPLPTRVLCAASAEEALELIESQIPAVVVSDHQLPGRSGLELLDEVRTRWPGVRGVLHTGDHDAQMRAAQLRFAVLDKGVPVATLRALVTSLLEAAA